MDQGFSQNQTGLLSNQSSKKYQEPQKDYSIEMQDMTEQQSYVLLTNEQTCNQTKQKQEMYKQTQPYIFNYNQLPNYQIQQLNQNQQQQVVQPNIHNNYQQYNKQQLNKKQNMLTHYAVCIFCKTPQTISNDQKPFMCYQCRQVQQATYEFIKCAHCNVTVKYQKGISSVIRCTKCNNHNFVQLQPMIQITQDKDKI
ncbi:unnamed protein product [Paramecium primaurelia]|uniref:Uncharacterized protein n=1 Tax=Paramecium primaurelia TaxID=5886 RepID=A0A8S1JSR9_PARPR|nr:unnamed protein product [Paramecium primaurelia]